MTDSPDIQYLKQDRIGKVIAKGLACVYETKPDKPITFFANWLLNHSKNLKEIDLIKKGQGEKKLRLGEHLELEKQHQDQVTKQEQTKILVQKKNTSFETKIKNQKYHLQLFINQLPQFLQHSLNLSGVYVGQLNFPSKQVTEQDIDQNAHLNIEAPKLIKYIGSSKSHQSIMKGKTLNAEKSVTAEVFTTVPSTTNQQGVEVPGEKPKYIYVADVVQNEKIHYFKLPKLGAYLAVPLVYKSYLSEATFNFVLEETKKEEKEKIAFEIEKSAQLEEIKAELEDAKGKLNALIEKQGELSPDANKDQIPEYKEVKDLEEKVQQKESEQFDHVQPDIVSQVKEFVVCADTLGQDRQITTQQRQFLLKYVDLFRNQWQECELKLLKQDVDTQIKYEKNLRLPVNQLIEQTLQDIDEFPQAIQHDLNQKHKDNEKLLAFETAVFKLSQLKAKLQSDEIQNAILVLPKFRVIRFPTLIQNLFYFLGHKKDEVDIQGTTHLNWKYVRENLINQKLIKKAISYDYRGPKHQEFKKYEKIDSLLTAFEKFSEDQILQYNIGLGLLLKFVKAVLILRKQDVQNRRAGIEEMKKKREQKERENEVIQEEKEGNLEKQKSGLSPQELEAFNEEEWMQAYEQEHPFVQIPTEVIDDVDNDI